MAKPKDRASKRSAAKKKRKKATKKAPRKSMSATALALAQPCLNLTAAAFIVGGCLPSGNHGNDDTLEQTGLISENLRLIFRECVFNGVDDKGCEIDRGQIPNSANSKVGEVIDAVAQSSR